MKSPPVNLGLYGCGNRTRALLDSLYGEREYQVVAAYDLRPEAVESAVARYGGMACASAEVLIGCEDVDAFLISLDPFAHPQAFHETVEAGKPTFIEKPIAMTAGEAFRMMEKAAEKQVQVQVGFMRRFLPEQIAAHRFIAENPPGRLFGIRCSWLHAGETEMINMLNHWPDNFRLKVSQIPFHCCHALDVMRTFGGDVKTVTAQGIKWVERPYPSPDYVLARFEFESGALGHFHYSSMSYKQEITYMVHFENYTLGLEGDLTIWRRPPFAALRDDGTKDCRDTYHKLIGPDRYQFGSHPSDAEILLRFLNAVRDGAPAEPNLVDGYKVAEIAEAIELSYTTGEKIALPLRCE
jgi:predicted dehydrogenase